MYRINSFKRVNSAKCCTHTLAVVLAKRYVHDLPAFVAGGGHHHRNVQPGVAGEQRAGKRGLQQHIVLGAHIGGQHFAAHLLGDAVHHAAALLLFPLVHLLREVVGRGAAAAGVGEHMHLEKADFLEEFAALFKIGLRLAGEAADAVGGKADRARTVGGAQLVHHLCILLGSVNAAHPAQGGSAAALQAQVELRAELFHGGKAGDELRREHIRVQTAQTDALDAKETLLKAQASITTAESNIASTKESLCQMLGWKYGASVEICALPDPQEQMSASVNLEEDIAKAQESNYQLKILARQVNNAMTSTLKEQYQTTLTSGKEAVKSNVQSAYQNLKLSEAQYEQAKRSLELEEKTKQTNDRKLAAGLISQNAYQSATYSYESASVAKETAAMSLLQAQFAYQWAVDGLASTQ